MTTTGGGGRTSFSLGLDASYQLDLFGGNRRAVEASRAQFEGSGFDYATTLLTVQSEVARNYVLARAYQAQLENAKASLAIQDDNLQIAGWRVMAGWSPRWTRSRRAPAGRRQPRASRRSNSSTTPPSRASRY